MAGCEYCLSGGVALMNLYIWEKIISYAVFVPLMMLADFKTAMLSMIVIGQAHFVMTYHYKYFRAGKPKPVLLGYVIFFGMFAAFWLLSGRALNPFIFVAITFFLVHNFFDDMKLMGEEQNIANFTATLPITVSLACYLFDFQFGTHGGDTLQFYAFAAGSVLLLFTLMTNRKPYPLYVSALGVVVPFLIMAGTFSTMNLLVFFVLIHCNNWYIKMGARFKATDKTQFRRYLRDVALYNAGCAGAFFLCVNVPALEPVRYAFFSERGFYCWTLMHLIFTLRADDFKNIRLLGPLAIYRRA